MTFFRFLLRNLFYHWRGNLAVLLGVAVGTAVLTGALLVGDCLRGSLRALTLDRLGWVDQALVAGRFFREEVGNKLPAERVSPAILLQGTARLSSRHSPLTTPHSSSRVAVMGIKSNFWPAGMNQDPTVWEGQGSEIDPGAGKVYPAVINAELMEALQVKPGDVIAIEVQKTDALPRESLLGKRRFDEVTKSFQVKIREILPNDNMGGFSLKPGLEPPRNCFVPLAALQEVLGLSGRVNALLVGNGNSLATRPSPLATRLHLDDWDLVLRDPESRAWHFMETLLKKKIKADDPIKPKSLKNRLPDPLARMPEVKVKDVVDYYNRHHPYLNLQSRRMYLEPAVVKAVERISKDGTFRIGPTVVYLSDSLSDGRQEIPYAVVAGLDTRLPPPLGPFQPLEASPLKDNEIILADWSRSKLRAKPGDKIFLDYYAPDDPGREKTIRETFILRYKIPLEGVADDPDLTPDFPGITDKLDIQSWENPPFPPYSTKKIMQRIRKSGEPVEEYWERYRTTPRAYVTLAAGKRMWGSRFGSLTSIRIASKQGSKKDLDETGKEFRQALLKQLKPEQGGFVFQEVKKQGLEASLGSTDFSEYFLYFSFFLIVSALLLVGLLFRLNLDRRGAEIGLLLAVGFRRRWVLALLLGEGTLLAIFGGLLGIGGAIVYAPLLLDFLAHNWPGEKPLTFLKYHAEPGSFLIGYGGALMVSILTILWAARVLGRVSPKGLLAGETTSAPGRGKPGFWSIWMTAIFVLGAVLCLSLGFIATDHESQAISFFGSGTCLLIALLAALWTWMRRTHFHMIHLGALAVSRLGFRNSTRHPVRSLLTMGLLASAAFVVVAIQCFHQEARQGFYDKNGGSGGFRLLAETGLPIFQDLNSPRARDELYDPRPVPKILAVAHFHNFRVQPGDDASCLNLFQPLKPRILGVPRSIVEWNGFRFSATLGKSEGEKANPWRILDRANADEAIPVFADATTAKYILHKKLGDTLEVTDDLGNRHKMRIAGLLQESIFQSELLMADSQFRKLFPRREGFSFFLIGCPPDRVEEIKSALEKSANNPGFFIMPTADRLGAFLAVENTYLAIFQALGGLGLLLGALGLAVVLLRSVWERRGELALMRALGFRQRSLGWLVLAENFFLLLFGLGAGTVSALVAVAPPLLAGTGEVMVLRLGGLLGLVVLVGLGAAAAAVSLTLRAPLLQALRRE